MLDLNKTLFVDYETYSEIDIKVGSFKYAMHPSTEIICVAFGYDKNNVNLWYPSLGTPPKLFIDHINGGGSIRSWNVTFEYAITNYTGQKYNFPKLSIDSVYCTMSDALALSLPGSLADAGPALSLDITKDKTGKSLITKLSKPRKATKNKPYTRITPEIEPELFQQFYDYCVQDVRSEIAIFETLPRHLKGSELEVFRLTLKINERGLPLDEELLESIIDRKRGYGLRLNGEIERITEGQLTSTNSRPQSLEWLKDNGLPLEGYTKQHIQESLNRVDISDSVRRFLEIRSELSRTPIKKFDYLNLAKCDDGTIKNNIIFHKATTGRFAGSGFQIQNLPRDSHKEPETLIDQFNSDSPLNDMNIFNEAIKLTRSIVTAKPGHKLVVSDFSSIENRVIAWLAGDTQTLIDFDNGVDQYKTAASGIYGVDYEDVTKDQRQLGKISVLSCCFGGGAKTFKEICKASWGIDLTLEDSQMIVDGYRSKYSLIVKLWYALNNAAKEATVTGQVTSYRQVKFRVMGDFLYMRLPSGRMIAYYKPKVQKVKTPWGAYQMALTHMGMNTYTRKWERLTVTPGRLTENLVQATARDFLTESMLRCEKAGYTIVACVHDENVTHVKEDFGSIEELDKIMSVKPEWAFDCPIDAEGFEGKRYRK